MIDYTIPLLLTLCVLGLAIVGAFSYEIGRSDEKREHAKQEYEAENAKLRGLVREIWSTCPTNEDDCKKCPHHTGESVEDWCDFLIRMDELGVEVDG